MIAHPINKFCFKLSSYFFVPMTISFHRNCKYSFYMAAYGDFDSLQTANDYYEMYCAGKEL